VGRRIAISHTFSITEKEGKSWLLSYSYPNHEYKFYTWENDLDVLSSKGTTGIMVTP
jgi:hypothetical protein